MALPNGYDTEIGDDGCFLSGGNASASPSPRHLRKPALYRFSTSQFQSRRGGRAGPVHTLLWLNIPGNDLRDRDASERRNILQAVDRICWWSDGVAKA